MPDASAVLHGVGGRAAGESPRGEQRGHDGADLGGGDGIGREQRGGEREAAGEGEREARVDGGGGLLGQRGGGGSRWCSERATRIGPTLRGRDAGRDGYPFHRGVEAAGRVHGGRFVDQAVDDERPHVSAPRCLFASHR